MCAALNTMKTRSSLLSPFHFLLLAILAVPGFVSAATPANGTITPTGPTINFVGTAVGTGVVEDIFVLTVAPGDYTNKLVKVRVSWTSPSNDYDLALFKRNTDGTNGPQVGGSGSGIPLTEEIASINPSRVGPGDYNIVIA